MLFTYGLYASLAVCLLGLLCKVRGWLRAKVGDDAHGFSTIERLGHALAGTARTIFSPGLPRFLWAVLVDGILQRRVLKVSHQRWIMHMCIFVGFTMLVLFHAMGTLTSAEWFADYEPTLNPFLFLRDFFGAMVLVGVGLAVYRRVKVRGMRRTNRAVDVVAIVVVGLIILSGFALQAAKIGSYKAFDRMAADYADPDAADEMAGLRLVWSRDYGVAFPADEMPAYSDEAMALGRELNADSCQSCHAVPRWSFASYGLSIALRPAAVWLADAGLEKFLWVLHFMACFIGLAILPFTKFLHMFTSPLIIGINAAAPRQAMHPANRATIRAMELDACTHCSTCSVHCSVATALYRVGNLSILPSEKLRALSRMARGAHVTPEQLRQVRQGADICTSCHRCTDLCPVSIDLHDLWQAQLEDLTRAGQRSIYAQARDRSMRAAEPSRAAPVINLGMHHDLGGLELSGRSRTFAGCYRCKTCTSVCPVVQQSADPKAELDLVPHQIMHALGMGLREEAMGARMAWMCLSCYRCQESCPQGVRVTDILIELTNLAARAEKVEEVA